MEMAFLSSLKEQSPPEGSFKALREKSWAKLEQIGFASQAAEAFGYVPLKGLYLSSFRKSVKTSVCKTLISEAILPECAHSHLVFLNGHFSAELSDWTALPQAVVVAPLEGTLRMHSSFIQGHFSKEHKEENDPFAILNLALHQEGVFVYLPPNTQIATALQCVHLVTTEEPVLISPRVHLVLGALSHMRCIVTTHTQHSGAAHLALPTTHISLDEGAHLDLFDVLDTLPVWHFETVRATLKRNARFNSVSLGLGGGTVRKSYRVHLKGENSEAVLSGLGVLCEQRSLHTHALLVHEAPHTSSMQRFKTVCNDRSRSSFSGKIFVEQQAQKTQAYQLNNHLLLSPGAIANSRPNLEIFADDVKASHGSTVSQLGEKELFYLTARGIDPALAKRLLVRGFCREIIEKIPYDLLLTKFQSVGL